MLQTVNMSINNVYGMLLEADARLINAVSLCYFATSSIVFCLLVSGVTAPYGRYTRGGWGNFINGKFAWFIQEVPSIAIPVIFLFTDAPGLKNVANILLFSLFLIHYFQRACIFPFLIKGGKPTPIVTFLMALIFCVVNGYLQSASLLYHADYGSQWWTRRHIWIGIAIFFAGMSINLHSDHILRNLRKPGEVGYKIPKGGMFNFVSGANFFGEILEWLGFAVATWSLPAAAFFFFTCCNIGPRAWQHHKYYLQKFEDYPTNRKAVIPFLL